jgi:nucleoid-associated protein YgaU
MPAAADQLEQLKQKYSSVFQSIQQEQIRLTHVNMEGNKLFIQGDATSEQAKNRIWDQIKATDTNWQNDLIADIRVTGNAQQQASNAQARGGQQSPGATAGRTYTVKPGDSLSKIAKEVYGSANDYMKIFEANRDTLRDPNMVHPGQELKIP